MSDEYCACLQVLNIIRVLHEDLTITASSLYSLEWKFTKLENNVSARILRPVITFVCQNCEIINTKGIGGGGSSP